MTLSAFLSYRDMWREWVNMCMGMHDPVLGGINYGF
jgi:hypothetical protein